MMAQMGINRTGNDELAAKDAMDAESYFTPAWQESRSGVKQSKLFKLLVNLPKTRPKMKVEVW